MWVFLQLKVISWQPKIAYTEKLNKLMWRKTELWKGQLDRNLTYTTNIPLMGFLQLCQEISGYTLL